MKIIRAVVILLKTRARIEIRMATLCRDAAFAIKSSCVMLVLQSVPVVKSGHSMMNGMMHMGVDVTINTYSPVRLTTCKICRHTYLAQAHTMHCPCCGTVKLRSVSVVVDPRDALPKPIGRAKQYGRS